MTEFKEEEPSVHFDRKENRFVGITEVIKKRLCETYKDVDVDRELGKMQLWLMDNKKGKTRKGTLSFIINWLLNVKPSILPTEDKIKAEPSSPLGIVYKDYLKDLWKNREHILEFNTKRN
jgi:hypothetical protein